jgi:E1A/CREB-binding protein
MHRAGKERLFFSRCTHKFKSDNDKNNDDKNNDKNNDAMADDTMADDGTTAAPFPEAHLTWLMEPWRELLRSLLTNKNGHFFASPVDPVELGIPDYFDVIKKPMDLGTILQKIDNGSYHAIEEFKADVDLTFDNAMQYNENGSVVHDAAKELKNQFERLFEKMLVEQRIVVRKRWQRDRTCSLCCCAKKPLEPPDLFCTCCDNRIWRNMRFFVESKNYFLYCIKCYNKLDEDMVCIEKKYSEYDTHEEAMLQCTGCQEWSHEICGLYDKEHHSTYVCPKCLLKRQTIGVMPTVKPPSAEDLPHTNMTKRIEAQVRLKFEEETELLAKKKAEAEVRC